MTSGVRPAVGIRWSRGSREGNAHAKVDRVSGVERFRWFLNERRVNGEDFRDVRR